MAEGVYFDILTRVVGMEGVAAKIVKDSTSAGQQAGAAFSDAFKRDVLGATTGMTSAMEGQIRTATATLETASARVVKAKDAEADATGRVRIAETQLKEARDKYSAESSKYIAAEERLETAKRKQIAASADVAGALAAEGAAQEKLGAKQDAVVASSGTMSTALKGAATIGFGALGIGIAESIKKAGDFQQTQERLVTTAGETRENLELVSNGLLDMAGKVGYSSAELSKGMYTIESAGYHGADGLKVMQAAAQGARAEGADLTEVTDAVTTALHDYHLPAEQAGLITSKMVTAVGEGKTTFEQFASSLSSVQPLAGAAGISIDDLYGSLASMTASGMSAQQATQNMADAIRHLQAPTAQMREELSQVGIDSTQLSQNLGQAGLSGSMESISTAIMQHMGPSGTVLLNTFNQSKTAATDATKMFDALPPAAQKVAQAVKDGTISAAEFRKTAGGLDVQGKNLVTQWLAQENASHGFSNALKSGAPDVQTYTAALAKATGDASSMNVALMLTGENSEKTADNVKNVAATMTEADGSVKGWHDTQETFNQKLNELKDGLGATAIKVGNDFLPAMTGMLDGLKGTFDWLGQNKWALDTFLIAIGGAAAAFAVWKTASATWTVIQLGIDAASWAMGGFAVAEDGAAVSAGGLAAALSATGITEIVIGVTALVAGLIALGAGVKYAYDHWGWFHTAVQGAWDVLKSIGEWIGGVFVGAWHLVTGAVEPVQHAFGNVEHALGNVGHAIGNVLNVLKYAGAIVATVIAVPFVLAFKAVEATAIFLYEHVIKPQFEMMAGVFRWINDSVVQPIFHEAIPAVWHWLYENVIQPIVGFIKAEINAWGAVMNWLHDSVIEPVMHAISDVWNWIYEHIIKPVVGYISDEIHAWGTVFSWLHDSVIEPVGDKIGKVLGHVKDFFKDCVDWIETQWQRIEHIVGVPAAFIVNTVYNEGIRPVWNGISHIFGLDPLPEEHFEAKYAGGGIHQGPGVIPGYAPGQDTVNAKLSPGEGVAVPELVQAIGPANFLALNRMYSGGRPSANAHFAGGGIWGTIGGAISGAAHGVGDFLSDAWSGIKDTGEFLAKVARDPAGAIRDLFSKVIDTAQGTPGDGSVWRDALVRTPAKFLDAAIDKIKGWFGAHPGAGHDAGNTPWVSGAGAAQWRDLAMQALTDQGFIPPEVYVDAMLAQIMTESGGNPNIVQQVQDVNSGGNEGVGLLQIIPGTFESYRDPRDPDDRTNPKSNMDAALRYMRGRYDGDILGVWGHGHGYAGGGIVGYEGGGIAGGSTGDRTAIDRAMAWLRPLDGQPYNADGWLDCSGLASGIYDNLLGLPVKRAFTTVSDFLSLGFKRGMGGAFSIGVTPLPGDQGHMAMTFDGHKVESGGAHNNIMIDGTAAGADDAQFKDHYFLPGSIFSPVWTGDGASSNTTEGKMLNNADALNKKVEQYQKDSDNAKASAAKDLDAATKHDADVQRYLGEESKAQALALVATGAAKQKHLDAASHYRQLADNARAAADKSRADADAASKKADDLLAKMKQAQQDSGTASSAASAAASSSQSGSNGGLMTFEQFGEKAGGIAASGLLETFGLQDSLLADPNKSPLIKIAAAMPNLKLSGQAPINPFSKLLTSDDLPATHDQGGPIPPGLSLVNNKTGTFETVLNPQQKLDADRDKAVAEAARPSGPLMHIEHWHSHGDGKADARAVTRELNSYAGGGRR